MNDNRGDGTIVGLEALQLESVLTCPVCGEAERLRMPTDACIFFHPCVRCGTRLRPKAGDCCVFCSYGSVPCPPIQVGPESPDCCRQDIVHTDT